MKYLLLITAAAFTFVSCKKEGCTDPTAANYSTEAQKDDGSCSYVTPEPTPTDILIGTATTSNNETVKLYSPTDLVVGYSHFYAEVTDANGATLSNAAVDFAPMMDMGMMQHACPIIQPTFNSSTNRYEGVVIFQMSSMGGTWEMDVNVNGNPANFTLNVAEAPTNTKPVGVYTGTDTKKYVVSLVRPENWVTGDNELNIMIHRMDNMMSFPAVTDFDVVLDPEMMSMGHGSTGNVNPTHVSNGLYTGNVNFNMSGDWRLHLELQQTGTTIHSDAFLDILY